MAAPGARCASLGLAEGFPSRSAPPGRRSRTAPQVLDWPPMRDLSPSVSAAIGAGLLALAATATADGQAATQTQSDGSETPDRTELDHFENEVRPLLEAKCVRCHGPKKQKGGLRLDTPGGLLAGGEGGPIVVAGDPAGSRLIQAVRYGDEDLQMPPKRKLAGEDIAALERWVERGLALPAGASATAAEAFDLEARLEHWSFQPIERPDVPPVREQGWPKDDLDRFLLARLEREGLAHAPDATDSAWLRRVHVDLTGLPPTPEERAAFLADDLPDARERVVDRLLASPHYGERWARHWLDLVRYAETRGHEFDFAIPNAWQYRDYVVRGFEADVPYDRFVREHIAGDLGLEPRPHPELGYDEAPLGTGFWFLGDGVHSPVDIRADETDRVANQVDVLSRAFLGLTVACARCHDHKFDAISAEDFYALSGFAMGASYRQARFQAEDADATLARDLRDLQERHAPLLGEALEAALPAELSATQQRLEAGRALVDAAGDALDGLDEAALAARTRELAETHGLSSALVTAWAAEFVRARDDARHPLHARATTAADEAATPAQAREVAAHPSAGTTEPLLDSLYAPGPDGARQLLQNGHAARALPAGAWLLGTRADRPLVGRLEREALHFDPLWDHIAFPPGHQRDPSTTSEIQPGRTLRTRTFELSEERLSVLVRGRGFVYAAVDSHRLVQGPLHGALTKHIDTGGHFAWIELDLADYRGHRLHLEFSPRSGPEESFAVAGFALGAAPAEGAGALREDTWSWPASLTNADSAPSPEDTRSLVNWILQRPELFPLEHDDYRAAGAAYAEALAARTAEHPWASPTAPVMFEGSGVDEFVLLRGSPATPGGVAHRRFLEALDGRSATPIGSGSGRRELAQRLTSPDNPFLARVWSNRLWHHVFGRGLVATVDDFGAMGEPPSHPELLDFLADELARGDWSTKALLKRLVLSRAYGMASRGDALAEERDPNNVLLHRMPVRRLDAESLRDAILAVSGTLDPQRFGPSVPLHLTPFLDGRGRPGESGPLDGAGRRSLYLSVRRNFPEPFLGVFDFPNPATTMGRRANSNVPAQALTLLNDPFVHQEAERWATRTLTERPDLSAADRVDRLYLEAVARPPSAQERDAALAFVADAPDELEAWAALCHVLYNLKEFRYLP